MGSICESAILSIEMLKALAQHPFGVIVLTTHPEVNKHKKCLRRKTQVMSTPGSQNSAAATNTGILWLTSFKILDSLLLRLR